MTLREQLDICWKFADRQRWGLLASAGNVDDLQMSYTYYARINDIFAFGITETWRQMANYKKGRTFSFMTSNTDVFDTNPEKYTRLFLKGKLECHPKGSPEFKKFFPQWKKVCHGNPFIKHCEYVGILKPVSLEFNLRPVKKGKKYTNPVKINLTLSKSGFDTDGRYLSASGRT
jgi:hypothetical protein